MFQNKPHPLEQNITNNWYICSNKYKGKISTSLKVRMEEHLETLKFIMYGGKSGNHQTWIMNKIKRKNWKIQCILGSDNLLSKDEHFLKTWLKKKRKLENSTTRVQKLALRLQNYTTELFKRWDTWPCGLKHWVKVFASLTVIS